MSLFIQFNIFFYSQILKRGHIKLPANYCVSIFVYEKISYEVVSPFSILFGLNLVIMKNIKTY